jgi:hypothetical protein
MKHLSVYLGYDPAEHEAALVCAASLRRVTNGEIEPVFLNQDRLRAAGLYTRAEDWRGQKYDFASQSTMSTQFSNSRFLTPILAQSGWALFVDCDMVFYEDPRLMLNETWDNCPLYCVQHQHIGDEPSKMMGMAQTQYSRKNQSSVMLFDCDHPDNRRLSLWDVNHRPGRDLHQFYWLDDDKIGTLHRRWNQLVGVQPEIKPEGIVHWTLGGPWFDEWPGGPCDDLWLAERAKGV